MPCLTCAWLRRGRVPGNPGRAKWDCAIFTVVSVAEWAIAAAIICVNFNVGAFLSERQPVAERRCAVLATDIGRRGGQCSNWSCQQGRRVPFVPKVHVRVSEEGIDHHAMRFRQVQNSKTNDREEAQAWIDSFAPNSTVACYVFGNGAVKMDGGVPELSEMTYVLFLCLGPLLLAPVAAALVWTHLGRRKPTGSDADGPLPTPEGSYIL
mmetsp:Transcript_174/g.592  ORF Transcript_174/g.592 Transcript_174/m.592 type:complete len:209 (-) Transcript_174:49-675(-)